VGRNGGTLSVTPEALRFARNGLLWKSETAIPAEELEDLTLLEPEMGGARSLLAYFSDGVIVARSDRESFRFGYGLERAELEWLRYRIHEVLRQGQRRGPTKAPEEQQASDLDLPVFPRWSRLWFGLLIGGLAGRLVGGPLAVCVAVPFVEEVLNVGALLGGLAGAALTPSLFRDRNARRLSAFVLVALVAFAATAILTHDDLVRNAPSYDERRVFGSHTPADGMSELRLRLGFCVASAAVLALLLNATLLLIFRLRGGAWRPGMHALGAELALDLRASEGMAPRGVVLALALAGVAVTGLASQATLPDAPQRIATAPEQRQPISGITAPDASRLPAEQPLIAPPSGDPGPAVQSTRGIEGSVEGRLLYAGRPLHEVAGGAARFWFRNEASGREASFLAEHDPASSRFRWVGAPGTYLADVSVGPRHDYAPHVSYIGSATFGVSAGQPLVLEVSLERIIRLRQPVDNARTLPSSSEEPVYDSPVRFAWDAIAEASHYRCVVSSRERTEHVANGQHETQRAGIEFGLPPGRYEFRLSAHGPSGLVGRLEVYGKDYRAWSYLFSLRSSSLGTRRGYTAETAGGPPSGEGDDAPDSPAVSRPGTPVVGIQNDLGERLQLARTDLAPGEGRLSTPAAFAASRPTGKRTGLWLKGGAPCTIRTCDLQIRSSHRGGGRPPPGRPKHNTGRGIRRGRWRGIAPLLCLVGPGLVAAW